MKKIVFVLLGLVTIFSYPLTTKADEIDDVVSKYSLVGKELDEFEQQERLGNFQRSTDINKAEIASDYKNLMENGQLNDDTSYEEYYNFRTYPEPKDPVVDYARNSRGIQSPNVGDILITNSTNPDVIGHAGIYIGNSKILSIEGYGATPSVKSIFQWMVERNSKRDKWTKVYRPKAAYNPSKAANWGAKNILGKNISYGFRGAPTDLNPTYCSKIVFQSYWYANNCRGIVFPRYISPYALPNIFVNYGQPDHVATWTWRNIA